MLSNSGMAMGNTTSGKPSVPADQLETFAIQILEAAGTSKDIASEVAESLVLSDLRGHGSHGTRRLLSYVIHIFEGRDGGYEVDPTARSRIEQEGPGFAAIDGRNAFGQVVGKEAVEVAVSKATDTGVSVVGIRNATHLGRIGEWSERIAEDGFLFAAFVYNHGSIVTPPGAAQKRFSTNPISYGVPTFDVLEFPIVLDIATSQVAAGKVKERAARNGSIPEGWAVSSDGTSTTDPNSIISEDGAMLPLGGFLSGYKGFGLAMIAELFGALVGNAPVHGQVNAREGCVAAFVTIDPTIFSEKESIRERITALRDYICEAEYDNDVPLGDVGYGDEALLPGEPEYRRTQHRQEHGVPLSVSDLKSLCKLANELDVSEIPVAFREYR